MEQNKIRSKNSLKKIREHKTLLFMILPGLVSVFIFSYIPMYGIIIAFQNYNPMKGFFGSDFVGLKYFRQFIQNPYLFRLLRNTLLLGIYSLLWGFPASIILALLLDQLKNRHFKKLVQTISYMPYFISVIVVVGIISNFCAIDDGIFNKLRIWLGLEQISYVTNPAYFRSIFISSGIWQGIGWGSIIYLAALSKIDPNLIEAATIDGANRLQKVRHITWPAILPTTTIMLILSISGILQTNFQKVLLLYSEATYETADVISTYVYREGILGGRFEYTTAIGLLMSFVSFILLVLANTISKRLTENSLW
ncbi:ABC transporter permease [Treponema phagedenis]|uniref:ABC transporter permease n=1 Tax=Treponema phagedenis TaxID=162 RepID=UPI0001F63B34|nr:ABC transporter permease subunit [Treponema phagedenis]EFW38623.1 ABC transporter, permease protein [Treponema phagedenis F0421]TYT76819.1 sugar ABC transporter permease [Treponema phagedenis]TYT77679.1 sugar ABC transporter permease [Treponema phagedenis]